jgi:hypothetical protein
MIIILRIIIIINSLTQTNVSIRSEKSKMHIFTMNTICILMTGRTMVNIKYVSKK